MKYTATLKNEDVLIHETRGATAQEAIDEMQIYLDEVQIELDKLKIKKK